MSSLALLTKRWKLIVAVGLIFSVASLGVTMLFPLEYRADAEVFIISKSRYGVDPYTVVKSAERVGENIAQVMKTDDFLAKVPPTSKNFQPPAGLWNSSKNFI